MNNTGIINAFHPKTIVSDITSLNFKQILFLSFLVISMSVLSFIWGDNAIGFIAGITGVICVFLVNMRKLSNYFWGVINVSLYAYVAYKASYYGDAMLNGFFYFPMQFIGAYYWSKSMSGDVVIARKLTPKAILTISAIVIVIIFAYSQLLAYLNGNLVIVDSTTTVLSITAMFLMMLGYREQWACWIVINCLSIYMWVINYQTNNDGVSVLIMWCLFLTNSIYGLYTWSKTNK